MQPNLFVSFDHVPSLNINDSSSTASKKALFIVISLSSTAVSSTSTSISYPIGIIFAIICLTVFLFRTLIPTLKASSNKVKL